MANAPKRRKRRAGSTSGRVSGRRRATSGRVSARHRQQGSGSALPVLIFVGLVVLAGVVYLLLGGGGAATLGGDPLAPMTTAQRARAIEAVTEVYLRHSPKTSVPEISEAQAKQARESARYFVDFKEALRARARTLAGPGEREDYARAVDWIMESDGTDFSTAHALGGGIGPEVMDRLLRNALENVQARDRGLQR